MLMDKFKKFRELVDQFGCTEVANKIGYQKSAVSMVYNGRYDASPERIIDAALAAYETGMDTDEPVPDGYMRNAQRHLVPINMVGKVDLARDRLVRKIMQDAVIQAAKNEALRKRFLDEISTFCRQSADQYDKELGGIKGNVQITSYDGRYRIKRAIDDLLEFDERLQVAKELIDQCLDEWSAGSSEKIRKLIDHAFQRNQAGRVNTKRILSLLHLDIEDDKWQRAMQAIKDSVSIAESRTYLRFYERDRSGKYRQIPVGI